MIQINDLDLSQLQFDFELTWTVFFMDAKRTLLGRYGTRSERDKKHNVFFDRSDDHETRDGLPEDMSVAGFMDSMRAALDLHQRMANDDTGTIRGALSGKVGEPWPWRTPEVMPGIRRGCTHCHQVSSNLVLHHRKQNGVTDDLLWSYPMPDLLGMKLDPDRAVSIQSVAVGTEASAAGLQAGDEIVEFDGQPILSPADVGWVLHTAPEDEALEIVVRRDGSTRRTQLDLPAGWRRRGSFAWRWRSIRETMSRMIEGEAWHCQDADPERRRELGVPATGMAIEILGVLEADKSQLRPHDVIVSVDGREFPTASEFLAYVMQEKAPGSTLQVTRIRDGERATIELAVRE